MRTLHRLRAFLWLALVLFGAVARGQEAADDSAVASAINGGLIASAVIVGVLLALRTALPRVFAPEPATEHSKALNMLAAIAVGLALGYAGIAPAIAPGLAGKLVGGFLAACAASFGRDFFTRSQRVLAGGEK
jgi:hypothetical protein